MESTLLRRLFVQDKEFYRTVLKIGIPVVLQSLITIGVNMTDTLMLGVYGEIQLSGSSLAGDFINIFQILCFGIGGGAGVLTAQYWGSKDIPSLKKVVNIMLWIALTIAAIFTTVTAIVPELIMSIYTPDPEVIAKGVLYLQVSAAAFPLMGLSLTLTIVLRTVRQVRLPLAATITIFLANIFGNWVFIYGNLGAPELQIQGAAIATLICRAIEASIIGGYFFFADQRIRYRIKDFFSKVSLKQIKLYIHYSVPVIVSDALLAFGNSAVAMVMGRIGASFVAANAIIAQVTRLSTIFNQGVSNASGIITGNTLGNGEKEKAYHQGITFLCMSFILGLLAAVVILCVSPVMVGLVNITEETKTIAYQLMGAVAVMVVFQAADSVMTKGVLRAGGDTRFLMIADVLFLWLASIPLGYLAGLVLRLPPFFVYIALRIDWIIKAVWCIFRLRSKKWIRVVSHS